MKSLRSAARAASITPVYSDLCSSRLLPNGLRSFHTHPPRQRVPRPGYSRPGRAERSSGFIRQRPHVVLRPDMSREDAESFRQNMIKHDTNQETHRPASRGGQKNAHILTGIVHLRLQKTLRELRPWTEDDTEYRSFGLHSQQDLEKCFAGFRKAVKDSMSLAVSEAALTHKTNPIFYNIRSGFIRDHYTGLDLELKYAFQSYAYNQGVSSAQTIDAHLDIADMRYPHEWFPATRTMQRTVHLHVGPTNSGKTYHALKALENAKTGIYAGPLRLLAHEVYSRFTAKGIRCALVTGEELRVPEGDAPYFSACTVEMTPLNQTVDVAVIDEIQMIADSSRGHAWTDAFFGVQAKELHLCGEARTVDLMRALCARIGDKCIVHRYERLNPLEAMSEGLGGDLGKLQKGDCVVSFSRISLHGLKAGIEKFTRKRCAIVYGALPPETRARQAALFNDPNNDYDFLVASDAIGMGLNLEIKRVIFESIHKRDDVSFRELTIAETKQIGGRAGRFRTAAREMRSANNLDISQPASPSPGLVTTLEDPDLSFVQDTIYREPPLIETAGLTLPQFMIERFARTFPPGTPVSFLIMRLRELCRISGRFFLCSLADHIAIADLIEPYPLSINDRCVLLTCPIHLRDQNQVAFLKALAQGICGERSGSILGNLDQDLNLNVLDVPNEKFAVPGGNMHLIAFESLHRCLTMYLWLSYRYPEVFKDQGLAFHIKGLCEEKISAYLEHVTFVPGMRAKLQENIRKQVAAKKRRQEELGISQEEQQTMEGGGPAAAGLYEGDEEPLVEDVEELGIVDSDAVEGEQPIQKLKWNETSTSLNDEHLAPEEKTVSKENSVPLDQLAPQKPPGENQETRTGS